jgi:hypothetical protein
MAVRVWLETTIPPVFGKEMDNGIQMADILTRVSAILFEVRV